MEIYPPKILRASEERYSLTLAKLFNNTLFTSNFSTKLNVADVSQIFKKDDQLKTKNYKPVCVLPVVSNIFERLLHKQMNLHVNRFLSYNLCDYRKGFTTQQTLISQLEKWKIESVRRGDASAILIDQSKAFNTLNHVFY